MAIVTGTAGNDILAGTTGDDVLDGLTGADKMAGGNGNDVYFVDQAGDIVTELANRGLQDWIVSAISTTLAANVEVLELVGGALNGTGNASSNIILGNSFANRLSGGGGSDAISGGLGNDTLIGGDGSDYLEGEQGANLLLGGAGDDSLNGLDGASTMQGGAGNDNYTIDSLDDQVVEGAGQGIDGVTASISFDLSLNGANIERLFLLGSGDLNGTGNSLNNYIEGNADKNKIDGGIGNDTLLGGGGNDTLIGGVGNDLLSAGSGNDSLDGGKGNDVYVLGSGSASVTERTGEGIDEVRAERNVDLDTVGYDDAGNFVVASVEKLTLLGLGDYSGKGNALSNLIIGNSGDNELDGRDGNDTLVGGNGYDVLKGGAGNDVMIGGSDNDRYYVDSQKDVVIEAAKGGEVDEIFSSVSYTLSANVERLELAAGDLAGTGNTLHNVIRSGAGSNRLSGAAGDDQLNGGDNNDTLLGGDGHDDLRGESGDDRLIGGRGNDHYELDSANDIVVENASEGYRDSITTSFSYSLEDKAIHVEDLWINGIGDLAGTGNALNNQIEGGAGNDELYGRTGNDSLNGGNGNDHLFGEAGNDQLFDNSGDDTLEGGDGNDTLYGGIGKNDLIGGKGNDVYQIHAGTNTVTEQAGEGVDTIVHNKEVDLGAVGFENIENLTLIGADAIDGHGNNLNNVIVGNTGTNGLFGFGGADTLVGGDGDDFLDGGTGSDVMAGGRGQDYYIVDSLADKVIEAAGGGSDAVETALLRYTLGANIETLFIASVAGAVGIGNTLANNLHGAGGNERLYGQAGDDYLYGNGGDDTLTGGDGNDLMLGGTGNDVMAGGKGHDIYYVDSDKDTITELAGQGIDLVFSALDVDLTSESLANIDNVALQGTGNLKVTGNALANVISGNSGDNILNGLAGNDRLDGGQGNDELHGSVGHDVLFGGDGNDVLNGEDGNDYLDGGTGENTLRGGTGNDIYILNNASNTVEELANSGIDEIRANLSWFLGALGNIENLTLTGTASINGGGNALANVIIGNSGNNNLAGDIGNDTLAGGLGNDTLNGGAGLDRMIGGSGDDLYFVDNLKDLAIEGTNGGNDLVRSTVSYVLGTHVERLTLDGTADLNGTGNTLGNAINGNGGKNRLDGGAGDDGLLGHGGEDILLGGAGNDELAGGSENDKLLGDAGNDVLLGEAGNDVLLGGDGHDALDGGLGGDDMRGGRGNDEYAVDDQNDKVTELAGQGIDTVNTQLSFDLATHGANVERLILEGGANVDGSGNNLDNHILGNSGNNVLSGRAGNDTLSGSGGSDTLIGGTGNDRYVILTASVTLTELAGEGNDLVETYVDYTLGANLEHLTLAGASNITGNGNELGNLITGNSGNNSLFGDGGNDHLIGGLGNDTLNGGAGSDLMRGGKGNDSYYVDSITDQVLENGGEGYDFVSTKLSRYTLGANVEGLDFLDPTDAVGTGNALANEIYGDDGNDQLYGRAGNDSLYGGNGNDRLIGEVGDDVLSGSDGNDVMTGGIGNDQLYGHDDDDLLIGEAGNDRLDGSSGNDVMIGGAGNDEYDVDSANDVVQEAANSGIDIVFTTINYALAANVENGSVLGANGLAITGNDLNNVLKGWVAADTLSGGKGVDTLFGFGGADNLNGGDSNDLIEGGLGADTMEGGAGNDVFRYTLGSPADLTTLGGDLIKDFETGKDRIDLYDLFSDFDIRSEDAVGQGYLRLLEDNGNTLVQFDKDGGGDGFVLLATLQGVTNVTLGDVIYQQGDLDS